MAALDVRGFPVSFGMAKRTPSPNPRARETQKKVNEQTHISPGWRKDLACPACRARLAERPGAFRSDGALSCVRCGASYPVEDGIIQFAGTDAFYEEHGFTEPGRGFGEGWVDRLGLYFARHHYLHDISRAVPPGAKLAEVGCGGGSRYLASRYEAMGVDVSRASTRRAADVYPSVVRAAADALPLAESCAAGLVSSCLLEHLGDESAGRCLAEMARVLKPGGVMVHLFDLDTDGPFWRWAKKQPWHREIFVASKGHLGVRPLGRWNGLFREAGLEVLGARLFCKTWLQDSSVWGALDDPAVKGAPRLAGRLARRYRSAASRASAVLETVLDDMVGPFLPDRWAAKAIIRLKKQGAG